MHRIILAAVAVAMAGLSWVAVAAETKPAAAKPESKHANYTEKLKSENGEVPFDMVAIPGGEFVMGSTSGEQGRGKDEGPQLKVRLKPFWIGKCEVTWDEFDIYFREGNTNLLDDCDPLKKVDRKAKDPADAVSKPTKPYVDETYGFDREGNPAICMTHHTAMKYCEWLSKKTGKDYRLATEAEWEYACRAGTTSPYGIPEGDKLDDYAWYKANSGTAKRPAGVPHAVGKKKPNAWGLHDMHGNVMEWVMDHYVEDAYARLEKKALGGFVLSPVFPPTENKWRHVTRGGHFKDQPVDLRSAARRKSDDDWMQADPQEPRSIWWLTNYSMIGFRVVRPCEKDELTGIQSKLIKGNNEEFVPQ